MVYLHGILWDLADFQLGGPDQLFWWFHKFHVISGLSKRLTSIFAVGQRSRRSRSRSFRRSLHDYVTVREAAVPWGWYVGKMYHGLGF